MSGLNYLGREGSMMKLIVKLGFTKTMMSHREVMDARGDVWMGP